MYRTKDTGLSWKNELKVKSHIYHPIKLKWTHPNDNDEQNTSVKNGSKLSNMSINKPNYEYSAK